MFLKKTLPWNPILLFISVAGSLIAAEFILRLVYPSPRQNQVLCLEYRHSWIFNKEGFRDEEFDQKLKTRQENIILLGDSFVVGLGAERQKTFAFLLSKKMESRFEVFNLGKCDTGTIEQSRILSHYIDRIKPKMVVLFFYGNDIEDNFKESVESNGRRLEAKRLANQKHLIGLLEPIKPFFEKSMLYQVSRVYYRTLLYKFGISKMDYALEFELFKKGPASPEAEEAWQYTYQALSNIQSLCQAKSASLHVIYLPLKGQIIHWENVIRFYKADPQQYDRFQIDEKLKNFCDDRHIDFFDLAHEFDKMPLKESFYYNFDKHLTVAGNQEVYTIIYPYLEDHLKSSSSVKKLQTDV